MLVNTGLFDGFAEELTVWIKPLQSQKGLWKDICSLLGFVSTALTSYMNNPYPYMDKVSDLVSEAAFLKTGGLERSSTMDNEEKFRGKSLSDAMCVLQLASCFFQPVEIKIHITSHS